MKCPAKGIPYDQQPISTTPTPTTLPRFNLGQNEFQTNFPDPNSTLINTNSTSNVERFKRSTSNFSPFSFNPTSRPKHKKNGRGSGRDSPERANKGNSDNPEIGLRSLGSPKTRIIASNGVSASDTASESTNTEPGLFFIWTNYLLNYF